MDEWGSNGRTYQLLQEIQVVVLNLRIVLIYESVCKEL